MYIKGQAGWRGKAIDLTMGHAVLLRIQVRAKPFMFLLHAD
jgi:hypothetical protein